MSDRDFSAVETTLQPSGAIASESKNRAVLLAAIQAIAAGDFAALPGYLTDGVELVIRGFPGMDGTWTGCTDVVGAMQANFQKVKDQRPAMEGMIEQDDSVVVSFREAGVIRATGVAYEAQAVMWFRFTEGRIRRMEELVHCTMPSKPVLRSA
jgi:ketosteroid isomerase-like protein